jgi:hypothetical protein
VPFPRVTNKSQHQLDVEQETMMQAGKQAGKHRQDVQRESSVSTMHDCRITDVSGLTSHDGSRYHARA